MEESNITKELCELLSRLTYDEWEAVRTVLDHAFTEASTPLYDAARKELGPMTSGAKGPELSDMLTAIAR